MHDIIGKNRSMISPSCKGDETLRTRYALIRLALAAAVMICLMMASALAADTEGFTFSSDSTGAGCVVTAYTGTASEVKIPDWYDSMPVTGIGAGAFMGNTGIRSVQLPSSITSIGASAFKNCSALSSISTYAAASEPPAAARVPGDANEDGYVNLYDALAVLKYDRGLTTDINTSNADVNADGNANIYDALIIQQYSAGWHVTLK